MEKAKIARRNRNRGKANEKALCDLLGFRRVGTMGSEDGFGDGWSLEAKSRVSFIGEGWMQQAEKNEEKARRKGGEPRKPLVVCAVKGKNKENAIVMMRLKTFLGLQALAAPNGYFAKTS